MLGWLFNLFKDRPPREISVPCQTCGNPILPGMAVARLPGEPGFTHNTRTCAIPGSFAGFLVDGKIQRETVMSALPSFVCVEDEDLDEELDEEENDLDEDVDGDEDDLDEELDEEEDDIDEDIDGDEDDLDDDVDDLD